MNKRVLFTEGPIMKSLLLLAFPMIVGNILQQIYNLVDTLVVGRYVGANALAAVGASYSLMTFLTSLIIGLCMGSGALFSASLGAGKIGRMKQQIWLSFWFILGVTVFIYVIIYPGTDQILKIFRVPDEVLPLMKQYVLIVFCGMAFVFLYNFFAYFERTLGNSITPLLFLGAASVINIVLDLFLVLGLKMGVSGAAWATVIAQGFSGIGISVWSLLKRREYLPGKKERVWNREMFSHIIVNDMGTGAQQSVMNFGILMIQGLINGFGTVIMAAASAGVKIDSLAYMPAQEFSNAYSIFVAQNYGAGKKERIKEGTRKAFAVSICFCLILSVVIWKFAGTFMSYFVDSKEMEIIAEGVRYLHIEGAFYIGIGMLFLWYAFYRGIQRPYMSLILTIISLGTRVALAYALAPRTSWGVSAIWSAIPIGWFLADTVGWIRGRKI